MEEGPLRKTLWSRHSFQWTSGRPRAQRGGVNADRAGLHSHVPDGCPGTEAEQQVGAVQGGASEMSSGPWRHPLSARRGDSDGDRWHEAGSNGESTAGAASGSEWTSRRGERAALARCGSVGIHRRRFVRVQIPSPQACAGGDGARWWPKEKAASRSGSQQGDGAASETQVAFGGINGSIFSRRKEDTLLYASSDLYALFERGL